MGQLIFVSCPIFLKVIASFAVNRRTAAIYMNIYGLLHTYTLRNVWLKWIIFTQLTLYVIHGRDSIIMEPIETRESANKWNQSKYRKF